MSIFLTAPQAAHNWGRRSRRRRDYFEEFAKASCSHHETIDKFVDRYMREDEDAEKIRAYLHKELDRQTVAYNETIKPLDDANTETWERFDKALQTLLNTQPTTPAGLAALFACFRDNDQLREQFGSSGDYIKTFVETLAAATTKFAREAASS